MKKYVGITTNNNTYIFVNCSDSFAFLYTQYQRFYIVYSQRFSQFYKCKDGIQICTEHTDTGTYTHTHSHTQTHIYTYTHSYTHTHTHTHTYIYIYIDIYIYVYIYGKLEDMYSLMSLYLSATQGCLVFVCVYRLIVVHYLYRKTG